MTSTSARNRQAFRNIHRRPRRAVALLLALVSVVISATVAYSYLAAAATSIPLATNLRHQPPALAVAETGMALAMAYVQTSPDWRTRRTHGLWTSDHPCGGGTFTITGEDGIDTDGDGVVEGDGNLSDDPGDPLTLTVIGKINGITSRIRAVVTPQLDTKSVLYVVGNPGNLTTVENSRRSLLSSWYWSTTLIDDDSAQSQLESAAGSVDAVLISDSAVNLGSKLRATPSGVVIEDGGGCVGFGLASSTASYTAADSDQINIVNNSHPVTSAFTTGPRVIGPANTTVEHPSGTLAGGLVTLGQRINSSTRLLVLIDSGDALQGGGAAAGRRIFIPSGRMPSSDLTTDGQHLLRKAFEWADESTGASSFGYTANGSSSQRNIAGRQAASQIVLPTAGNLTSISAYIRGTVGRNVRYAIYTDQNGQPGSLITQTAVQPITVSGLHWKRINLTSTPLTAGTYWLALSFDDNASRYRYISGGSQVRHNNNAAVSNGFSPSWGSSSASYSRQICIYGVYTPQGSSSGSGAGSAPGYSIRSESFDWR